jgi:hypothetical protein
MALADTIGQTVASNLGTPEELWALAKRGVEPDLRPKVNAHVHLPPNFSAFETVSHAVELAAQQGVGVLGASNYYDFEIYRSFAAEARRHGIFPLFGLETIVHIDELAHDGVLVNDPGNPGKMYVCGRGITRFAPMNAGATRIIDITRCDDSKRVARLVELMDAVFEAQGVSIGVTTEKIADSVAARHGCARRTVYLQERHVAQAFQEALFDSVPAVEVRERRLRDILGSGYENNAEDAVGVQETLRLHLMKAGKPAFVESSGISFAQGYQLILELGGIPCYPVLADGAQPITPFESSLDALVADIRSRGIHATELVPVRNEPEVLRRYVTTLRSSGLVVTAGTEHNTLDMIPLVPTCVGGTTIPDELEGIFWEGACVVAAHQFLKLHDECGYVDGEGNLNPEYDSAEEHIAAFAALGAAVIERYYELYRGKRMQDGDDNG